MKINKKSLIKKSILLGKILCLVSIAVLPALVVFINLEIKKEHEKAFLLGEITKLKKEIREREKEKLFLKEVSTSQQESTSNSDLISKLLKEKVCYQQAIANIKMEDVDRLNQIRKEKKRISEECEQETDRLERLKKCISKEEIAKEEALLVQKTDRENFEEEIRSIDEWLSYLYKGQYPPSGNPSDMKFCDFYETTIAL